MHNCITITRGVYWNFNIFANIYNVQRECGKRTEDVPNNYWIRIHVNSFGKIKFLPYGGGKKNL